MQEVLFIIKSSFLCSADFPRTLYSHHEFSKSYTKWYCMINKGP